jgi:outer membrane receptor protein involved in Fe transport
MENTMKTTLRLLAGRILTSAVAGGLLLGTCSSALAQQKTGSITFVVTDVSEEPLADVAITLEGEKIPGFQLRETNAAGRAHFSFLPPGAYTAEFTATGYMSIRLDAVVGLGATLVERVTLSRGTMEETMTVRAQAPLDASDTGINYTYDEQTLESMQVGSCDRSYQSILQQAAGVGGGANPAVHGATLGENRYLIDGVDTTDPVTGTFGMNMNYDAIEAVEFKTGGFQAEFGQATGGIINVITKSGGNEFSGSFDLRYNDNGMQDSSSFFDNSAPAKFRNIDLTLGGPIVKDKVWFFLAASDTVSDQVPAGATATRSYEGEYYLAKLRFQPNQDHRIEVLWQNDPAEISNANAGTGVAEEAHRFQEQGSDIYTATYWGRLSEAWEMSAQAGYYDSELNSFSQTDTGLPGRINDANGYLSNNYIDEQFSERKRTQFGASATYRTSSERWHEIKFGIDVQDTEFSFNRGQPGGSTEHVFDPSSDFGKDADPYRIDVLNPAPRGTNEGMVTSVFIQDTWHASDRVTIDYGLRWDQTKLDNDVGDEVASFDLFQPRLGATIDLTGKSRTLLTFHLGRFMDPGILAIANAVNENGDSTDIYLDPRAFGLAPEDGALICGPSFDLDRTFNDLPYCTSFGGPSGSAVDPDLNAMYVDEATIGVKHAFLDNLTFGARYVYRQTDNIIEDILLDDGHYLITNLDELTRRYHGIEFDMAFNSKRWHVFANYTIAWAKGNIEYTQHLGTDYDIFPDHYVNRYGYLSTDRRHSLKVHGWVELPKKFEVAWDFFYGSGAPYERVDQLNPLYGEIFLDPRGSSRLPSVTNLDVEGRKHWDWGSARITLIASINNLLKGNSVTARNRVDGNPDDDTDNAPFGDPTAYQATRDYEVGLRVTW